MVLRGGSFFESASPASCLNFAGRLTFHLTTRPGTLGSAEASTDVAAEVVAAEAVVAAVVDVTFGRNPRATSHRCSPLGTEHPVDSVCIAFCCVHSEAVSSA